MMIDRVVDTIQKDGDFKGAIITILGVVVTLAPYIALGFNCPVPKDVVWVIKCTGYLLMLSGIGISFGYLLQAFSLGRQLRKYFKELAEQEKAGLAAGAAGQKKQDSPPAP